MNDVVAGDTLLWSREWCREWWSGWLPGNLNGLQKQPAGFIPPQVIEQEILGNYSSGGAVCWRISRGDMLPWLWGGDLQDVRDSVGNMQLEVSGLSIRPGQCSAAFSPGMDRFTGNAQGILERVGEREWHG